MFVSRIKVLIGIVYSNSGNIEDLKKQHEEQMKQITEQQELSKARANEDLQAKLAQRRSRRNRMAQQEAEMEALVSKWGTGLVWNI